LCSSPLKLLLRRCQTARFALGIDSLLPFEVDSSGVISVNQLLSAFTRLISQTLSSSARLQIVVTFTFVARHACSIVRRRAAYGALSLP